MLIELNAERKISVSSRTIDTCSIPDGWIALAVSHCAICRTDAKMCSRGHRDLVLPRVPGHEIIGLHRGSRFAVWPGVACGNCSFCKSGRENLCDSMKIIGFHLDGGFSDTVLVPASNCVPVPEDLDSATATFAEPAGCIINAFEKADLHKNSSLLIFGAGTIGILSAVLSLHYGARPVIVEKNLEKISRAQSALKNTDILFVNSSAGLQSDIIMNCCPDPQAFIFAVNRAAKGATVIYFSGLDKNSTLDADLLNLIHYRELIVRGSYGLTKYNLIKGLELVSENKKTVKNLIEKTILPQAVPDILQTVLDGEHMKYIISF